MSARQEISSNQEKNMFQQEAELVLLAVPWCPGGSKYARNPPVPPVVCNYPSYPICFREEVNYDVQVGETVAC